MGRGGACALNLGKLIRNTSVAILEVARKEGKMKTAHKLVRGGATAPTIGWLGKENVFSKAKNYEEATVIWEEVAKKLKEEASVNWEVANENFQEAIKQSNEVCLNWEERDTTSLDQSALSEYHARVSEDVAKLWEEEAKEWGMALKTAQEKAKHWEEKARKRALGGSC